MQQCQVSFTVSNTNPATPLGVEIHLDHQLLLDRDHVVEPVDFVHVFDDSTDGEHLLTVTLKNKTRRHTRLDSSGVIIADALIKIDDIKFDEIDIGQMATDLGCYVHNNNGATDTVEEKFYGAMGCNGQFQLKFSTPVYQWLLDNM